MPEARRLCARSGSAGALPRDSIDFPAQGANHRDAARSRGKWSLCIPTMTASRRIVSLCLCVALLNACSQEAPTTFTPETLLAELQASVRNPGGTCWLDTDEPGTDPRIERLMRATSADVELMKRPSYEVEPALELVIRAPRPQAPRLHVLVYLRDDQCERFDLADMWNDPKS